MVGIDPIALSHQVGRNLDPIALSYRITAASGIPHFHTRSTFRGDKYPTGFGPTKLYALDYWELRERSAQLFTDNLFARGLIRRLITAEIGTGLTPELEPVTQLLEGVLSEDDAEEWADDVEVRFDAWANTVSLADYEEQRDFAELQADARREALVDGDVLVYLRVDRRTGCPQVQLIRGHRVQTPLKRIVDEKIVHGVELDSRGRQVAYHVKSLDFGGESVRIPAYGPRSGKRMAWLLYGTDKRIDAVRGTPLLGIILQALKELDRFSDSELRAATVNSILAMFIERQGPAQGTNPVGGGAVLNTAYQTSEPDRTYDIAEQWPGLVMQDLAQGEKPHSFNTSRPNANFGVFREAVLSGIAWANEIPPEVLLLQFGSNYTASKAATAEFQAYVMKTRRTFGGLAFCQPIFCEWLVNEVDKGRIDAPGLVESMRDRRRYAEFQAWTRTTWGGPVRPSIELHRDVRAYVAAVDADMISLDFAGKALFGVRSSRVLPRRLKERRELIEMQKQLGVWVDPNAAPVTAVNSGEPVDPGTGLNALQTAKLLALVEDHAEQLFEDQREGATSG